MKMKMVLLIAATVLSISVLSACGSNSKQTNQSTSATTSADQKIAKASTKPASSADQKTASAASNPNASAQAAPGKLVEITLNAKDFEYDKKVIHVKQGDKVKLTLNSDDDGGHGFALPAYNINLQKNGSAEFTADKAGTYEYHCSVMCGSGHMNMTGKLVVE